MHWKFNSDHFTLLRFENPSSVSTGRQQFWQQQCYQVAAFSAAGNLILIILLFQSLKICPAIQKLGGSFVSSFASRYQLSQQLGYQVAAQCTGNFIWIILHFKSLNIHPVVQNLGVSFGISFAIGQQLSLCHSSFGISLVTRKQLNALEI